MEGGDACRDREPEAGARRTRAEPPVEAVEDARPLGRRDAGPLVANEEHGAPCVRLGAYADGAAARGVAHRVVGEVAHQDAEEALVASHGHRTVRLEGERDAAPVGGARELAEDAPRDLGEVAAREAPLPVSGVEARQGEELLAEPRGAVAAGDHLVERVPPLGVSGALARDLRLGADRGERRAELVRGVRREGALPLEEIVDPREQRIQALDERTHLARCARRVDRLETLRIAPPERLREIAQRPQRAADREGETESEQRERAGERHQELLRDLAAHLRSGVAPLADLHQQTASLRPRAEDAPVDAAGGRVAESFILRGEPDVRRRARVQAQPPAALPHLEDDAARVGMQARRVLELDLVVVSLGDQRDEQRGRLRQVRVEELVDLVARLQVARPGDAQPGDGDRRQDAAEEAQPQRGSGRQRSALGSM